MVTLFKEKNNKNIIKRCSYEFISNAFTNWNYEKKKILIFKLHLELGRRSKKKKKRGNINLNLSESLPANEKKKLK